MSISNSGFFMIRTTWATDKRAKKFDFDYLRFKKLTPRGIRLQGDWLTGISLPGEPCLGGIFFAPGESDIFSLHLNKSANSLQFFNLLVRGRGGIDFWKNRRKFSLDCPWPEQLFPGAWSSYRCFFRQHGVMGTL